MCFWQERGSAFNGHSAAELIMRVLMQTEGRQGACEQLYLSHPHKESRCPPHHKKTPSLTPPQVYHTTSSHPSPLPTSTLLFYCKEWEAFDLFCPPLSPSLCIYSWLCFCPPQHQQLPTSFVLHSTQSKPFSVLHQGSTSQLLCLQWMLTPYCCWGTYSTKAGGSIRSWRSRGARVTGGARLTISPAGTRASLE